MNNDMRNIQMSPPLTTSNRSLNRWFALLIIGVIASAGGVWMKAHINGAAAQATGGGIIRKEQVQEMTFGDFATIEAREIRVLLPISGTLTPLRQATVKAKVIGEVREALIPEGVHVARGQVVVQLDSADLTANLMTQQAALEDAKVKLRLAMKTHNINLTLLQQKFISQTAFDTAESTVEIAMAAVKSTQSQVEIAHRALDDALVRAPIDGIISKRLVLNGEKASPDTPLFSIVDLSQLVLEAQVPTSEIPRVKVGQEVSFDIEGFHSRQFKGAVARINPATEVGSRVITVYIVVNNADGALRSGMFAKGAITLDKSEVTPVIPLAALRKKNDADVVLKIENNKVVTQAVQLGLRDDDNSMVSVLSGLNPGARVIVVKLDSIKDGTIVKLPESVPTDVRSASTYDANPVKLVTATGTGG